MWKLRIPLKVKIFLWYLRKGVTLTKDNLIKRHWKGDSTCCFCSCKETIRHLFFDCHVAKFVWNSVGLAFGIQAPTSIDNLLGSWLRGFPPKLRKQVLVGMVALCWAIWLNRNDAVFCRKFPNSYLQVIFRGTFWARHWSQLSKEEAKDSITKKCRRLESVIMELFAKHGWNF